MLGFHAVADPDEQITRPGEIVDARWFNRAEIRAAEADANAAGFGIPFPSSIAHFLIMKWLDES